ncbi:hypothetical protein DFH07DRAFT_776742 [Mycena maculata]|uniref:Uncharacterized protein n=1 Tax=Mycena maculata TaxID=230809 RepID=A0AAD7IKT8_9AGAR|nr:hypothetical protein DFH07DRAFT_776742 [Mycena maculata]
MWELHWVDLKSGLTYPLETGGLSILGVEHMFEGSIVASELTFTSVDTKRTESRECPHLREDPGGVVARLGVASQLIPPEVEYARARVAARTSRLVRSPTSCTEWKLLNTRCLWVLSTRGSVPVVELGLGVANGLLIALNDSRCAAPCFGCEKLMFPYPGHCGTYILGVFGFLVLPFRLIWMDPELGVGKITPLRTVRVDLEEIHAWLEWIQSLFLSTT